MNTVTRKHRTSHSVALLLSAVVIVLNWTVCQAQLATNFEVYGARTDDQLGASCAALGDINGDGLTDVGVSVWGRHEFRIYFGSKQRTSTEPDLVLPGGVNALMADLNADGYKELIVVVSEIGTIPNRDTLCVYAGRRGPGLRIDTIPSFRFAAFGRGSGLGIYLASGDLNGDGCMDLAVGARSEASTTGSVYIVLGHPHLDSLHVVRGQDLAPGRMEYGRATTIADLNGDGFGDLIVGERYWNNSPTRLVDSCWLNIYYGHPGWEFSPASPDLRIDATTFGLSSNQSITSLSTAAFFDANADGRADVFVASDTTSDQSKDEAFFIFSTAEGIGRNISRILKRVYAIDRFGEGACPIGDINADGYEDFAIPFRMFDAARVDYYPGTAGGLGYKAMIESSHWQSDYTYGNAAPPRVAGVGDFNGDGIDDVLVSSSGESIGTHRGYFHVLAGTRRLVPVYPESILPAVPAVSPAWPNPASTSCSFDATVTEAGSVHVTIHDLLGRLVRTIEVGSLTPGSHTVTWDGRDAQGAQVIPGVYWYTMESVGGYVTGKVVLR